MSRRLYLFLFQRKLYTLFSISFLIFWNSTTLAYESRTWYQELGFWSYFYLSKRVSISCWPSIILPTSELLRIDWPKLTSSVLMEIVELVHLFHIVFTYITYILLRQVISLKKKVVLSVNVTILILWSPVSFNPFISINEIGKYRSQNIV